MSDTFPIQQSRIIDLGILQIDLERKTVSANGVPVRDKKRFVYDMSLALKALFILAQHPNTLLSEETLYRAMHGIPDGVPTPENTQSVKKCIWELRGMLNAVAPGAGNLIQSTGTLLRGSSESKMGKEKSSAQFRLSVPAYTGQVSFGPFVMDMTTGRTVVKHRIPEIEVKLDQYLRIVLIEMAAQRGKVVPYERLNTAIADDYKSAGLEPPTNAVLAGRIQAIRDALDDASEGGSRYIVTEKDGYCLTNRPNLRHTLRPDSIPSHDLLNYEESLLPAGDLIFDPITYALEYRPDDKQDYAEDHVGVVKLTAAEGIVFSILRDHWGQYLTHSQISDEIAKKYKNKNARDVNYGQYIKDALVTLAVKIETLLGYPGIYYAENEVTLAAVQPELPPRIKYLLAKRGEYTPFSEYRTLRFGDMEYDPECFALRNTVSQNTEVPHVYLGQTNGEYLQQLILQSGRADEAVLRLDKRAIYDIRAALTAIGLSDYLYQSNQHNCVLGLPVVPLPRQHEEMALLLRDNHIYSGAERIDLKPHQAQLLECMRQCGGELTHRQFLKMATDPELFERPRLYQDRSGRRYRPETYTPEIFETHMMQLGMLMHREADIEAMMVRNDKGIIRLKPGLRLVNG